MRSRTISQVEIDKRLIGNADLLSETLKVGYGALVHPESNLPFQPASVWVLLCL